MKKILLSLLFVLYTFVIYESHWIFFTLSFVHMNCQGQVMHWVEITDRDTGIGVCHPVIESRHVVATRSALRISNNWASFWWVLKGTFN